MAMEQTPSRADTPRRRRGLMRPLLLFGVPLVAGLAGLYWYAVSGRYVTTENAYVKSDIVTISTDVDGRVVSVEVTENQLVEAGQVLLKIDPEPFQIALDMADASLLSVRNDIEASRAEFRQVEAEIDEAQERVAFYQQQAQRQRDLQERGIAAQVSLEEAELELAASLQRVTALREKLRTVLARLGGDPASAVELHPSFMEAEARRDMAALDLDDAVVRAPVAGFVSRMQLQPGEWLEAGDPAFTIIDPGVTWIEANLKETQLTHIEVGQQVDIEVDAYPDHRWQGQIASISPATGAEFALIPPQNASGNWVKVVQRLPVRILVQTDANRPQLRAGMTAAVSIDTRREPRLAALVRQAVASVSGGR